MFIIECSKCGKKGTIETDDEPDSSQPIIKGFTLAYGGWDGDMFNMTCECGNSVTDRIEIK